MKLYEVTGAGSKVASFALGRLNPATIGHELLVNAIKQEPGDSFLFLTDRAPKLPDNPLSAIDKLNWARQSFNGIAIGLSKTVLTAADRLYKMGYTEVTFLEGEPKLLKILQDYNGVEKPMHNYNFNKINYKQLTRDPEAAGATAMSGTKLRGYVTNNDLKGFAAGATQLAQPHTKVMFKKLQVAMGVDLSEPETQQQKKDRNYQAQADGQPKYTGPKLSPEELLAKQKAGGKASSNAAAERTANLRKAKLDSMSPGQRAWATRNDPVDEGIFDWFKKDKEDPNSKALKDPQYLGWKKIYKQNPDVASMHRRHKEFLKLYKSTGGA